MFGRSLRAGEVYAASLVIIRYARHPDGAERRADHLFRSALRACVCSGGSVARGLRQLDQYRRYVKAVRSYVRARIRHEPLVWVKTEHAYPSRSALVEHKRKLGEILIGSGCALNESDVRRALEATSEASAWANIWSSAVSCHRGRALSGTQLATKPVGEWLEPWVISSQVAGVASACGSRLARAAVPDFLWQHVSRQPRNPHRRSGAYPARLHPAVAAFSSGDAAKFRRAGRTPTLVDLAR